MTRIADTVKTVEVDGAKFHHVAIPGLVLVEPIVRPDDRGFFLEVHHRHKYAEGGIDVDFVQDNHSQSKRDTLRGLHTQVKHPQGKLLRTIEGAIFDVAVDVRRGSPTRGKWYGTELSAENFRQLYVPAGFLHGFCVVSDRAQVEYKVTDVYHSGDDLTVAWDDPELAVEWPVEEPFLSPGDEKGFRVEEVRDQLADIRPYRAA
ncbi:MAG: dTDP-4-dehydrorhamnose 3,5-epimerase [Thermoanaerobaculia bacterium]